MKDFLTTLAISAEEAGIPQIPADQLVTNILNLFYFITGVLAVVIIIVAGIMYTLSGGDSSRVTKAKNMLTYSVIGLIVVLLAFTITSFVTGRFK